MRPQSTASYLALVFFFYRPAIRYFFPAPTTKRLVRTSSLDYFDVLASVVQEVSRRELRKALERQGVASSLREEEILVLCDSLDPDRRGRVRLTDVRDSLLRGTGVAGQSSEFEVGMRARFAGISTVATGGGPRRKLKVVLFFAAWESGHAALSPVFCAERWGCRKQLTTHITYASQVAAHFSDSSVFFGFCFPAREKRSTLKLNHRVPLFLCWADGTRPFRLDFFCPAHVPMRFAILLSG